MRGGVVLIREDQDGVWLYCCSHAEAAIRELSEGPWAFEGETI